MHDSFWPAFESGQPLVAYILNSKFHFRQPAQPYPIDHLDCDLSDMLDHLGLPFDKKIWDQDIKPKVQYLVRGEQETPYVWSHYSDVSIVLDATPTLDSFIIAAHEFGHARQSVASHALTGMYSTHPFLTNEICSSFYEYMAYDFLIHHRPQYKNDAVMMMHNDLHNILCKIIQVREYLQKYQNHQLISLDPRPMSASDKEKIIKPFTYGPAGILGLSLYARWRKINKPAEKAEFATKMIRFMSLGLSTDFSEILTIFDLKKSAKLYGLFDEAYHWIREILEKNDQARVMEHQRKAIQLARE